MPIATLTIVDDFHGEYEDSILFPSAKNRTVSGRLGGDPLMRDTIELLSYWVANYDQCGRSELTLLGRYLYAVAFGDDSGGMTGATGEPSPLRDAFEESYAHFREQNIKGAFRLRLVIRNEATQLKGFPWEFLFKPQSEGGGFFMAGEKPRFVLTRYIPNAADSQVVDGSSDPYDEPLRILVVLSRPQVPGLAEIEARKLVAAIESLRSSDTEVEVLPSPTRKRLSGFLDVYPAHILHFIGHGKANALMLNKDEGALERERLDRISGNSHDHSMQEMGEADQLDSRSVCSLFCRGLDTDPQLERMPVPRRLIFLQSCYGATVRPTGDSLKSLSSIARDLAGRERVSAVIAMQHAIASEDAERFAIQFYRRIGSEARVDDAVSWARRELGEISSRGRQVWDDPCFGTPVIYVCRDGVFFPRRRRARNEVDPAGTQGHRAAPYASGLSGPPPMPGRRPGVGNPRDAGRSARGDAHSPGAEPDVYGED